MGFLEVFWSILIAFAFIAYLMLLFSILSDLIRDRGLSGWAKAIWIFFLIFAPFLTALVYIIVRGPGMTERSLASAQQAKSDTDAYIRDVAGQSPTQQIESAKALLDSGSITQDEFNALKSKALG